MCGLVALFNKNRSGFSKDQQDVFTQLLFIDFLRGPDSTGAFLVTNRGDMHLAKEASDSLRFIRSKEFNELQHKAWSNGSVLVGHNRKATIGTIADDTAHPFVVDDNIVLVHNGTLWGDHKKIADVEVDSHAIAHAIHETGDVTKALSSIEGAYALIWYDVANERVHLIRNSQRPLWWIETPNSWIWSSEKAMLDFVVERQKLTVREGPHELPEDTLQTYQLKNGTWEVSDQKLKIEKKSSYSGYNYNWNGGADNTRDKRHLACGYYPNYDDETEETIVEQKPSLLPAIVVNDESKIMKGSILHDVAETYSQLEPPGTTSYAERLMCQKLKAFITNDEWKQDVVPNYPYGCKVIAEAFDYAYANQKDEKGGYYLYCRVCDDPDLIVRQWFDSKYIEEEAIIQWASSGYVYEFQIAQKAWKAMAPGAVVGRSPGFVIMQTEKATLVYGGGIGDKKYSKDNQQVH